MQLEPIHVSEILRQQREALRNIPESRRHIVPADGLLLVAVVTTDGDTAFFNLVPDVRRSLPLPWGA